MLILYNITAKASFYDRANLGDYNFTVAYTWGGKNVVQTVTSTIFVIDACIKNVNKPTVPAIPIKFLMDLDTFVDVKPVIDVNHTFCLYNISMSYIKLSGPVSSGPTIFFTTMINETYADMVNAKVLLSCLPYDLTLIGTYNISLYYEWVGPTENSTWF